MNLIIIFNYLALPIIVDALYKITYKHFYWHIIHKFFCKLLFCFLFYVLGLDSYLLQVNYVLNHQKWFENPQLGIISQTPKSLNHVHTLHGSNLNIGFVLLKSNQHAFNEKFYVQKGKDFIWQ